MIPINNNLSQSLLLFCILVMGPTTIVMAVDTPPIQVLSLTQSIALGLKNSTQIAQQQSNIDQAKLDHGVYNERYAPDYFLNVNLNWTSVDIEAETLQSVDENAKTQTIEFKVLFPWWHKESLKGEAAQKRIDIEIQKNQLRNSEKNTEMEIYRSYFSVVMQQAQLKIAKHHQSVAQARQKAVLEQLKLGQSPARDLNTENSNVINHNVNVESHALELLDTQEKLLETLGLSMEEVDLNRLTLSDALSKHFFDIETLNIDNAITEKLLGISLEQARQRIAIELAKTSWSPKLSAQVSYTPKVDSIGSSSAEYNNLLKYGVSLQLPFPNKGLDQSKTRLERHLLNDLLVQREQQRTTIIREVAQLKRKLKRIERKITLLNQLVLEKEKEVVSAQDSFSIGRTSNLELQMVESVMMDAESNLYNTLYGYTILKGELLQLHGISLLDQSIRMTSHDK